jgi:hypothetical protein
VLSAVGQEAEAHKAAERALETYARKGHLVGVRAMEALASARVSPRA